LTSEKSLYDLKCGDKVLYIGDKNKYSIKKNQIGVIQEIDFGRGHYKVQFDSMYKVFCSRIDLFPVEHERIEEEYNGTIFDIDTHSQMRYFLNHHHSFSEGIDYVIGISGNEVYLTKKAYSSLIENIISNSKVIEKLANNPQPIFFDTFRTEINEYNGISCRFSIGNFVFRTHLLKWEIQRHLLGFYGVDIISLMKP